MRHFAVFVNPLAGNGKPLKVLPAVEHAIAKEGFTFEVITDQFPAGLMSFSDIIIVGGDGTINYIINRYREISVPIGIVPAGSGNDLAYTLFPSHQSADQIQNAIHGKASRIDAGCCNGRIFLNCLGIGFDGEVAKEIPQIRWLSGRLKYYWVVIKKIISYRSSILRLTWDQQEKAEPVFMVTTANGYRSGGGFKVAPGADWRDGLLELVIIRPLPVWKRFFYLPRIEHGTHLGLSIVENHKTRNIRIQSDEKIAGHLDGELTEGLVFDISVMPSSYIFRGV